MILIISACEVGSSDPGCTGARGRGSRTHIVGCWHAPQATAPEVTNHNASCGVEAESSTERQTKDLAAHGKQS